MKPSSDSSKSGPTKVRRVMNAARRVLARRNAAKLAAIAKTPAANEDLPSPEPDSIPPIDVVTGPKDKTFSQVLAEGVQHKGGLAQLASAETMASQRSSRVAKPDRSPRLTLVKKP